MTELKPCPFCGTKVALVKRNYMWFFECRGTPMHRVQMEGMDFTVLQMDVLESAMTEWNRRMSE